MKRWIFGLLLFLSSCYVKQPHEEEIACLQAPPSLDLTLQQKMQTHFFEEGNWPDIYWWAAFGDPLLDQFMAQALQKNPTLHEAASRVELAKASAIVIRSHLFPLVTFDGFTIWEHLSKNGLYRALNPNIPLNVTLTNLSVNFTYEIDFWGKNANLFYSALGQELAREAEWAQAELMITTTLAQTYFALKSNLQRKKLFLELAQLQQDIFSLQDLLRQKALSSQLIPLQYEENLWKAEELVAAIDAEISANYHMINVLMGQSPDCPLCIDDFLPELPKQLDIPCDLSIDLLARRPDLMAQIWVAKSLSHEVGAAMAAYYPNVSLQAFLSLESTTFQNLFTANSLQYGIQPAVHLPIFTAGAIQAQVNEKKALFDQAIFAYNDLLLKSAQEVADLLDFAQSIFQQKILQEKVIANAERLFSLNVLKQKKGLNSLIPTYFSKVALIEKKLDDIMLLYQEYVAAIKLIKALGGGYFSPYVPLEKAPC